MTCCPGKRRHDNIMSAIAAAIRCSRRGTPLRVYRCRWGGWHLTSKTREEYERRVAS
jgi:hypothetical protein